MKHARFLFFYFSAAFVMWMLVLSCKQAPAPTQQADAAEDAEPEMTASFLLNQAGDTAVQTSDYDRALALYQQSMDSAAVAADSFNYYDSRLDMACVYDRLGELDKSIQIGIPVLEAFIRSGDSSRIGRTYATLSAFYGRANMPDKAFEMAQKGFDIVKYYGSDIERCAAYNQMAFTYSDDGRWKEALPLLDTALMFMYRSGVLDQLPGMCLNVGDCHRQLGNMPEAKRFLYRAVALADSSGQMHIKSRSLERLSQIAEAEGNVAVALPLYRKAVAIKDSIFKADKVKRLQELEVQYKTREKEQEIALLRAEEHASAARRYLIWVMWLGTFAAAGLGLVYWRFKAKSSERALHYSRMHLEEFTRILLDKNARLLELEQELNGQDSAPALPELNHNAEDNETEPGGNDLYNFRILTDQDWSAFKQLFERSYPNYLYRLRTAFPDITSAEERLSLLLKINLHRQEIATMLGVSDSTVKKGRARLRRRLALSEEQSL
ncbi:MAG: tetratricopeptide repeat protein, partial [Saprospiraceae bacterium]|nr:tetratricopeptide repeat protein [Saprospiraceae bacterium]